MLKEHFWITSDTDYGAVCPMFEKSFVVKGNIAKAEISLTVTGVYAAFLNGERIGNFVMAPGWTNYKRRLQYQTYDITKLLKQGKNTLNVLVGNGWYRGALLEIRNKEEIIKAPPALICEVNLDYGDSIYTFGSDKDWLVKQSRVRFSDLYNGEIFDANFDGEYNCVKIDDKINKSVLIKQEGEEICEQQVLEPVKIFISQKGERIVDFGQEITGYIEVETAAKKGETVDISFAEALDKNGNFYCENYRSAKCIYRYICKDGVQSYKPYTTFYGFRYIKINSAPENTSYRAIVLHSKIQRTGFLKTNNKNVNRLFENILWGQKGNFLDVPTDCPQRDERLGWTGDAQVFAKTAMYQFNVKNFFKKWLNDMMSEQRFDGLIPNTVPDLVTDINNNDTPTSAAWGDAATVCPWTLYEMYADKSLLKKHFPMMKKWVSYIESTTCEENLWIGHIGFGDWLALDNTDGSYVGKSRIDFISSAYYKHSVDILALAAEELNENSEIYLNKSEKIKKAFAKKFPFCETQTEYALALRFGLTDKREEFAESLAKMVSDNGYRLNTGFVGTPHLLFALSDNGFEDVAYRLLLQEEFPSWLYSVKMGATTVWEHWDGINEQGEFWDKEMNSFNHYAYGSVGEWAFSFAAGIEINSKGISISPHSDKQLGDISATYISRFGKIVSDWYYENGIPVYEIEIPIECDITINNITKHFDKGKYIFKGGF